MTLSINCSPARCPFLFSYFVAPRTKINTYTLHLLPQP